MGVLEFLVPFYPINTTWMVFSLDLKMDPVNLYPKWADSVKIYLVSLNFSIVCLCFLSQQPPKTVWDL